MRSAQPRSTSPAGQVRDGRRVTTAARAFVLALGTGSILAADGFGRAAQTLIALLLVAAASMAADLLAVRGAARSSAAAVPVLEGVLAALVLAAADAPSEPLMVYLVVPVLVAGVRLGARAALLVSATTWVACVGAMTVAEALGNRPSSAEEAFTWLVLGLGAGLFAAVQSRATRAAAEAEAPYAAARHLVDQLHALVERQELASDPVAMCAGLQDSARSATGALHAGTWLRTTEGELQPVAAADAQDGRAASLAREALRARAAVVNGASAGLPLRVGDYVFGALVLTGRAAWSPRALEAAQREVDQRALPLDTALLIDGLRASAVLDERRRLARDLHDGVAQRLAALGLLVDELTATMADRTPTAEIVADELREEVTGVVDDLRVSMHDLRTAAVPAPGLRMALVDLVRRLDQRSGPCVHLDLDEDLPRLLPRVETELVRVAHEAVANAGRHGCATNIWLRLGVRDGQLQLLVEDDGIGGARPRPGHYGLLSMRERAGLMGAQLDITDRPGGGTLVALVVPLTDPNPSGTSEGLRHDRHRLARR